MDTRMGGGGLAFGTGIAVIAMATGCPVTRTVKAKSAGATRLQLLANGSPMP